MIKEIIVWIFCASVIIFGIKGCADSKWYQEHTEEEERQQQANATPHVIREADGCKVYAFESGGNNHFFTRCATETTTERHYSESCGKNQTCQRTEEISTVNGVKK